MPEFKSNNTTGRVVTTPSQTQRGFEKILKQIGTPAERCVARGKPCGRMQGDVITKRERHPIIFKTKKPPKQQTEENLSVSELKENFSNPQKINQLIKTVRSTLKTLQLSTAPCTGIMDG